MSRFNGLWVQEVRQAFLRDPEMSASISTIFGAPKNNYAILGKKYRKSHQKPDKKYSTLPTILELAGDYTGMIVADLGCGDGFFTIPLARHLNAEMVVGVDKSLEQLVLLEKRKLPPTVRPEHRDIFVSLPYAHLFVVPYVINYADDTTMLEVFFNKLYEHLYPGGRIILVVDLPSGDNLKRFGATKIPLGPYKDGTRIQIDLYQNSDKPICRLHSTYFRPRTITAGLRKVGFKRVQWHTPIVSPDGYRRFGRAFWKKYLSNPELGYVTAMKS